MSGKDTYFANDFFVYFLIQYVCVCVGVRGEGGGVRAEVRTGAAQPV